MVKTEPLLSMKLTDAFANILIKNDVKHAFGLQGGAVVHIFDSLERLGVGVTYTNHEQSAALAAVVQLSVWDLGVPGAVHSGWCDRHDCGLVDVCLVADAGVPLGGGPRSGHLDGDDVELLVKPHRDVFLREE